MPDPISCEHLYGETPGTEGFEDCLSYRGKYKYNHSGKLKKGGKIKNPRSNKNKKPKAYQYSAGGMLMGPSHENGGISAIVDGTEPIEVEGGEFIINKQTVDAVGEDFLHKLNSTQTTHHSGGYGQGELPSPSNYKSGGKLIGENKMRNRRTKPVRKMGGGGRACGPGTGRTCMGGGYRRGGRTRPVPRRAAGGITTNNSLSRGYKGGNVALNKKCRMNVSAYSCKNTRGCTWNIDHCI